MESFSTQGLPVAKKLALWNEMASITFAAMEVRPNDSQRFFGSLARERLGAVSVMNVYSDAVRIRHTREHVARMNEPSYLLLAPLQREVELSTEGSDRILLRAGECCLIDHARTYELAHGDSVRTLCVDLPRQRLEERLPGIQDQVARVIRPDSASARIFLGVLRNLGNEVAPTESPSLSPSLGETLLEFFATTYAPYITPGVGRGTQGLAKRYMGYIDLRITDPELSPHDVAVNFGISDRYLRFVLSRAGEKFSSYLLGRRLQRSARLLVNPHWSERTITDIAFNSGFSNVTHFGQVFKARYRLTPREYRTSAKIKGVASPVHRTADDRVLRSG